MTVRDRVAEYRARMRAAGLRPVQIWAPDTRAPEFAIAAHRASMAVAASSTAEEDMDFVESVSAWTWDDDRK